VDGLSTDYMASYLIRDTSSELNANYQLICYSNTVDFIVGEKVEIQESHILLIQNSHYLFDSDCVGIKKQTCRRD
jgi:hypothetical protein